MPPGSGLGSFFIQGSRRGSQDLFAKWRKRDQDFAAIFFGGRAGDEEFLLKGIDVAGDSGATNSPHLADLSDPVLAVLTKKHEGDQIDARQLSVFLSFEEFVDGRKGLYEVLNGYI